MRVIVLIVRHGAHGLERRGREQQHLAVALAAEDLPGNQRMLVVLGLVQQAFETLELIENEQIGTQLRGAAVRERYPQLAHHLALAGTVALGTQAGNTTQLLQ
ncbi:hypothetical protein D3C81_1337300 [compost metagenome]